MALKKLHSRNIEGIRLLFVMRRQATLVMKLSPTSLARF
jgi:hypothetical protein